MKLLKELVEVRGASGDEVAIKEFILKHIDSVNLIGQFSHKFFMAKAFKMPLF